jgi:AcrR family transcriptional regulator
MPRLKDSERDQVMRDTRQFLLQAASEEFARHGYDAANVNNISRAAGFAKGTIYNYFPSKRALMEALIDTIAKGHLGHVVGEVGKESDPRRRLERFFEVGFAFVVDHLAQARVLINNIYGPDDAFKVHMYAAYRPMFDFVGQEVIAPGIAEGVFRQVDVEATSSLLMTIYLGTASQVDDQGRTFLDARQVANFALHALRCPAEGE